MRSYLEWREIIYRLAQEAVDRFYEKQSEFADEVGKPTGEVSLRLRRAEDGKGYPQILPADYFATLAMKPGALEYVLNGLAKEKGYRLEPERPPTDLETWRALAAEMTEKQRRRVEKERGWPEGWLDR